MEFGVKARRAWLRHAAWFALAFSSCDFATAPIVDPRDPTSGSGGDEPTAGDGGTAGGGGKGGRSGAGTGGAGAGGAGSGGTGAPCVRNAFIECIGSAAIRCAANGRDTQSQDCGVPGCNPVQKRCNACTPGETFCADPSTLATCGPDGLASSDETCVEGCNSSVSPALCNHCAPGISFCIDGNTVRSCDGEGNAQQDTQCPNGCTVTSSSTAQCNQCTPGEVLGCADSLHQSRCKVDGTGPESVNCDNGCSGDGVCNACTPDSTTCSDADTLTTCNASGTGSTDTQCGFGCSASSCNDCRPSTTECQGNDLVVCSAAGKLPFTSTTTCPYGCDSSATPDVCKPPVLVPSNLYDTTVTAPAPANPCEIVTTQDISVAPSTINTDGLCTRIKTQAGALPDICVIVRRNITFETGSTVTVTGSRALALVATGTMTLNGTVIGSASGTNGGPGSMIFGIGLGGSATALPDDGENTPGNAGGGGGGFGMMGGAGGDDSSPGFCNNFTPPPCAVRGGFGMVQGAISVVPLYAGSGGGVNSAKSGSPRQGLPGGGGGALQLVGCTSMTIASGAAFAANGGGGEGGRPGSMSTLPGAGAGGGSGGAILLEAQSMSIGGTIQLFANGGGGGGGASVTAAGADGDPGKSQRAPAIGGAASGGGTGFSGAGGPGGYANMSGTPVPAGVGATAGDVVSAAGGGGGGVGRIRLNNTSGSIGSANLIASPVQTLGMIAKCTASPVGPCLK